MAILSAAIEPRPSLHPEPVWIESEAKTEGRKWCQIFDAAKLAGIISLVTMATLPLFVNPLFAGFALIGAAVALCVAIKAASKIREYKIIERADHSLDSGDKPFLDFGDLCTQSDCYDYIKPGDVYACFHTLDRNYYGVVFGDPENYECRLNLHRHVIQEFVYKHLEL